MPTLSLTTPEVAPNPPRNRSDSGFGEFFRYHGYLAPGVRLFRRIGFPAKVAWVALAFLVPLVMSLGFMAQTANEQLDETQAERRGLSYVQSIDELIRAASERRSTAALGTGGSGMGESQAKVAKAFDRLRQLEAGQGTEFGTAEAFGKLATAHEALLGNPQAADADATFQLHSDFIQAGLTLAAKAIDGSKLSIDPNLLASHLINLGVVRLPQQAENLARMRGIAVMSLRSQQLSAARRDVLQRTLAVQDFIDADVETSFHAIATALPAVAESMQMKESDDAVSALVAAVGAQVLGAELAKDAAAFQSAADLAVDALHRQQGTAVTQLDALFKARVDRLRQTLGLQVAVAGLFIALGAYLMLAFYKVMMGGLAEVSGHLEAIANGNLGTAPRPWGKDEAAQLMLTLGEMQGSLRRIVGSVLTGAQQVQTASQEIAAASQDLSTRTEMAAASLQASASSMAEIAGTVKHTAQTVHGATAIVQANAEAAKRGGAVIGQLTGTMQGIQTSSNKIGEIIGVIDGIAFQTNILALNAAVEAARAGEQGRGFAVVASEVRALASRSSGAAREIKSLIGASIEQVGAGVQVAASAGATMAEIVDNAGRIAALMDDIETVTREQTTGVDRVGTALSELDRATQQNAALVEQTSAASSALSEQARQLATAASFFQLT